MVVGKFVRNNADSLFPVILFMAFIICPVVHATNVLSLSTTVFKGSCTFILPESVELGIATQEDFTLYGGTVHTLPFDVRLTGCIGPSGGTERASIIFMGTTLTSDRTIFNDNASDMAGFMFKEGHYNGELSSFKSSSGTVTEGMPSQEKFFIPGKLPDDGTIVPYTVGFVSNGKPNTGRVSAKVTFQMSYR